MAKGNLPAVLAETLMSEGGYSSNPKDPGNWTGGKVGAGSSLARKRASPPHPIPIVISAT